MNTETRTIYAYAHTHWDREWYQPFETFRLHLVDMVRRLLPALQNGDLPKFYMDGQAIILEDVVALDPDLAAPIKSLMAEGKLTAGPWYVLPDEMLVSGESLIRNLAYGLETTKQFGPPAMIGYAPDTFGHSQDLPTILMGFGITNAIVWRGVPFLEMGPVFWWNAPSGATVLAYHLTLGYYRSDFHELGLADFTDDVVANAANGLRRWAGLAMSSKGSASPYHKLVGASLMPIGVDHGAPPAKLQMMIDRMNQVARSQKLQVHLQPTTLADFMRMVEAKVKGPMKVVQGIDGELRFNRSAPIYERSYLLYGVLSTRLYLKRANRLAEHRLTRLAEPVRAIADLALGVPSPRHEYDYAWKLLLKNHPHDSICGCSIDAVHDEMMTRTAQLNNLIDSLLDRTAADTSRFDTSNGTSHNDPAANAERVTVFNTASGTTCGPVWMRWAEPLDSKQTAKPNNNVQVDTVRKVDQLFAGWGALPYYKEIDLHEGWVWAEDVPSYGFRSFAWPRVGASDTMHPIVEAGSNKLSNGHLSLTVSASGRLTVSYMVAGKPAATYKLHHVIRDVADCGDTYNFDPLPGDKPIEAKLVGIEPGKKGPLLGSLILKYEIEIPEGLVPESSLLKKNADIGKIAWVKRSRKRVLHEIDVQITLKRGVPILFFDAIWKNRSRDHRLEVCFDTGREIATTYSENHLSVVPRAHQSRSGKEKLPVPIAHEAVPDRFPAQRFVVANDQAFFNMGMPEYGVDGSKLTLTMLRSTSFLSKPQLYTRGGGAGPNVETLGANCIGENKCSYGWAPVAVSLDDAYRLAESFEGSLWACLGKGRLGQDSNGVDAKSFVHVSNPAIRGTAFYAAGRNVFILRLLNTTNEARSTKLLINKKHLTAELADMAGNPQGPLNLSSTDEGYLGELNFGAYEVKTIRLSF